MIITGWPDEKWASFQVKWFQLRCLAIHAHTVETGWCSYKVIIAQVKIEGIFQIDFEFQSLKNRGFLASTAQRFRLVRYYDIAIGYVIVPVFRYNCKINTKRICQNWACTVVYTWNEWLTNYSTIARFSSITCCSLPPPPFIGCAPGKEHVKWPVQIWDASDFNLILTFVFIPVVFKWTEN